MDAIDPTTISPLASVPIDQIFLADPRTLTDTDHRLLLSELRKRRSAMLAEDAAKQAAGKAKRAKAEPQTAAVAALLDKPVGELDLGDLI